jgi:hypothetical protein
MDIVDLGGCNVVYEYNWFSAEGMGYGETSNVLSLYG